MVLLFLLQILFAAIFCDTIMLNVNTDSRAGKIAKRDKYQGWSI